ncbi:MAG: sulfatase [Bryobacterales bacterium]|nr:sulfatase [Bryobacterales bacterium]
MRGMLNRREFVAGLAAPLAMGQTTRRKPNLLFVFSDQHRACSMPGEPYSQIQAPNLARLAREGLSVRNCVSNYPVCSPYRAMLLSGRWPFQTGITDNDLALRDEEVSLGEAFAAQGYRTGYVGKWHLSTLYRTGGLIPKGPGRQGFEDWRVWFRTNTHFDTSFTFDPDTGERIQPEGYNCTLMTDDALKFLGKRDARPWMLMVSWNPPHTSYGDAPPEKRKLYDAASMTLRPNVTRTQRSGSSLADIRRSLQGYSAHISAIDDEFGRLLRWLDESGQAENTIVVYTSDHGAMIGSNGWDGKRLPHEESCKPPFLVRYPGVTPAGQSTDLLLSAIDIYPTLCGLAGFDAPGHCAGQDLSAHLRSGKSGGPESAFLMHIAKEHATGGVRHEAPLFRGVRTHRHTYAVADDGAWCLFDNREDPYQMHNLIDDPARAGLRRELGGLTMEWLRKAQDPFPFARVRRGRSALASDSA